MNFEAIIAALNARLETALAGVPSEAQAGGDPAVNFAIRSVRTISGELKSVMADLAEKAKAKAKKDAEDEEEEKKKATAQKAALANDATWLKENKLVKEADMETAITAARNDEKAKVQPAVDAQMATLKQTAERRREVVEKKLVPAVVCASMDDALFQGEKYLENVNVIGERLKKLATIKSLATDEKTQQRLARIPVTAEGLAEFETSFEIWKKAAGGSVADPLNPPSPDPDKKAVVLF